MTVALNNLVRTSTGVGEYNVDMAAAIIAAAPTLFVYIVAGSISCAADSRRSQRLGKRMASLVIRNIRKPSPMASRC